MAISKKKVSKKKVVKAKKPKLQGKKLTSILNTLRSSIIHVNNNEMFLRDNHLYGHSRHGYFRLKTKFLVNKPFGLLNEYVNKFIDNEHINVNYKEKSVDIQFGNKSLEAPALFNIEEIDNIVNTIDEIKRNRKLIIYNSEDENNQLYKAIERLSSVKISTGHFGIYSIDNKEVVVAEDMIFGFVVELEKPTNVVPLSFSYIKDIGKLYHRINISQYITICDVISVNEYRERKWLYMHDKEKNFELIKLMDQRVSYPKGVLNGFRAIKAMTNMQENISFNVKFSDFYQTYLYIQPMLTDPQIKVTLKITESNVELIANNGKSELRSSCNCKSENNFTVVITNLKKLSIPYLNNLINVDDYVDIRIITLLTKQKKILTLEYDSMLYFSILKTYG